MFDYYLRFTSAKRKQDKVRGKLLFFNINKDNYCLQAHLSSIFFFFYWIPDEKQFDVPFYIPCFLFVNQNMARKMIV